MSNKNFMTITINDDKLRKQIRGSVLLRNKQIHKSNTDFTRKPKHFKGWNQE